MKELAKLIIKQCITFLFITFPQESLPLKN